MTNKLTILLLFVGVSFLTAAKNQIIPNKGANDPHIRIFDGKVYLSTSHDKSAENKKFIMEDWMLWSSDDLVNWKPEYALQPRIENIEEPCKLCRKIVCKIS